MSARAVFPLFLLFAVTSLVAQDSNSKLSVLVFADYYYVLQHHNHELKDANGFWFRRIYATYDHKMNESFSARFRLDMKHEGDFKTAGSMVPSVKDAYLKYSSSKNDFIFGISPTPTFQIIEKYWGYRSIEQTMPDLQKFGSSRGLGIAAKGKLANSFLQYHFMFANGSGGKSDDDQGKKFMLSLSTSPSDNFTFEIYGDWNDFPGEEDWYTMQAFLGVEVKPVTFGIHFTRQIRGSETEEDLTINAASAFMRTKFNDKVKFFLRGDFMFDPNPLGEEISYLPFAPNAESTFLLAGLDFMPAKNVSVIPNIQAIFYNSDNADIDLPNDVVPRITLVYKF